MLVSAENCSQPLLQCLTGRMHTEQQPALESPSAAAACTLSMPAPSRPRPCCKQHRLSPPFCVQVVLAGLVVLLPHMRTPLLAFPKLCQAFFSLVGSVLEVHPQEIARLQGDPQGALASCFWQA